MHIRYLYRQLAVLVYSELNLPRFKPVHCSTYGSCMTACTVQCRDDQICDHGSSCTAMKKLDFKQAVCKQNAACADACVCVMQSPLVGRMRCPRTTLHAWHSRRQAESQRSRSFQDLQVSIFAKNSRPVLKLASSPIPLFLIALQW